MRLPRDGVGAGAGPRRQPARRLHAAVPGGHLVTAFGASVRRAGYLLAAFGLATIPSRLVGGRSRPVGDPRRIVTGQLATAAGSARPGGGAVPGPPAAAVVALGLAFEIYEPASQAAGRGLPRRARPVATGCCPPRWPSAGMAAGQLQRSWPRPALALRRRCRDLPRLRGRSSRPAALTVRGPPPQPRTRLAGPAAPGDARARARSFAVVYLQVGIALPLTAGRAGPAGRADRRLLDRLGGHRRARAQPLLAAGLVAGSTTPHGRR